MREKRVEWVGSSQKDLRKFPSAVREVMGFALYQAQLGRKHIDAKPLKGFKGAGVLEIVDDYDSDTYRTVYTTMFPNQIWVLHAFKKKSKKGAETPKSDLDLVKQRLKYVEELHKKK